MFSLICASINRWVNNREAGDLRRYRAHYDVIVMCINPSTARNAWVHTQHCSYWCTGARAPCHQYPQYSVNTHCIGAVANKNIRVIGNNIGKLNKVKQWPIISRVNGPFTRRNVVLYAAQTPIRRIRCTGLPVKWIKWWYLPPGNR